MEVAHGIDLKHVCEHWHHQHVANEASSVVFEVRQEVKRSHDNGHAVNAQHDYTSESQEAEKGIWLEIGIIKSGLRVVDHLTRFGLFVFGVVGDADWLVNDKSPIGKENADTDNCEDSE